MTQPPEHLSDDPSEALPTAMKASSLRRAIANGRQIEDCTKDYLDQIKKILLAIPLMKENGKLSISKAIEEIDSFLPIRDEYVSFIQQLIKNGHWNINLYINFFESLVDIPPSSETSFNKSCFSHIEFLRFELLLYTTSFLIKEQKITDLTEIVDYPYSINPYGATHTCFFTHLRWIENEDNFGKEYNRHNNKNWISPISQWIKERASLHILTWEEICNADLMLCLKSVILRKDHRLLLWKPISSLHWGELIRVPLFSRFVSKKKLQPWLTYFGVQSGEELRSLLISSFPENDYQELFNTNGFADLTTHLSLNDLGSRN